jgi:hypothetical protein
MDLVVKLSKEEGRLHVVFTSSDSFFQRWIEMQGMIFFAEIWTLDHLTFYFESRYSQSSHQYLCAWRPQPI